MLVDSSLVLAFVALAFPASASPLRLDTRATKECQAYTYAPYQAIKGHYPAPWSVASFSFKGVASADVAAWNKIKNTIPAIPLQAINPSTGAVKKFPSSDPYCWWTNTNCVSPKLKGLSHDTSTCSKPNTWGLTLDDGPSCEHNAYFDYLLKQKLKATLFYIGSNVATYPIEGKRGVTDGHQICAHTWSHNFNTGLSNEKVAAELYYSKKIIQDLLGVTVNCWRPPYGDVDDRVRFIAKSLGLTTILWDNDTNDAEWTSTGTAVVKKLYNKIINAPSSAYAKHGTIVLSHEQDTTTMGLSEEFLPAIMKRFTGGVMPVNKCNA